MYKKQYTLILILAIVGIIVAGFFARVDDRAAVTKSVTTAEAPESVGWSAPAMQKQEKTIVQNGRVAEEKSVAPNVQTVTLTAGASSYTTPWREGMTVIDAMNALKSSGTLSFSAKEFSGLGMFVEEIGGTENGGGFYWILYVNGKESAKGASQTVLAPGDHIEWKYVEKY